MALIKYSVFSESLKKETGFYVSLPRPADWKTAQTEKTYQVLYLLHGASDDFTKWIRRVPIERITRKYQIAVVVPDASLSFYSNTAAGENYYDYIGTELPCIVKKVFPVSKKREDTFIAGLSMGGYGALRIGLSKPQQYQAAASFSGGIDLEEVERINHSEEKKELAGENSFLSEHKISDNVFFNAFHMGIEEVRESECFLPNLIDKAKKENIDLPDIYQSCGTEDFLYQSNLRYKKIFEEKGVNVTYEEWSGNHDWDFWEESLKRLLEWLPLKMKYIERTV